MRILIAPDKFKGSLTAVEAAQAIARGFLKIHPEAETVQTPIADGGEGTAAAIQTACDGKWIATNALDPLGRKVEARYAWIEPATAVIDMSEASGLWRLKPEECNPLRASTFGTGQLVRHAIENGAKKVLVGLGGSATNDGGIGLAAALGFQFLSPEGRPIPAIPARLVEITRIEPPVRPLEAEVVALSDVGNPLTGPRGASRIFGPQKGASPDVVEFLDAALAHLARLVQSDLGFDFSETPGAGAAGGLGFSLLSFCRAKIQPGFETLDALLHLEDQVAASDLVITGEGRVDTQTLEGKGPAGIARVAKAHGKPVIAFAGCIAEDSALRTLFTDVIAITPEGMPLAEAIAQAPALLEAAATRSAQRFVVPH